MTTSINQLLLFLGDASFVPPPPANQLRITDDSETRLIDDGEDRVTD